MLQLYIPLLLALAVGYGGAGPSIITSKVSVADSMMTTEFEETTTTGTTGNPPFRQATMTMCDAETTTTEPSCHGTNGWEVQDGMDEWCERNCNHVPPFCPAPYCICD
ncbi:uncharacterized protein [Palaemon carinicauda]|uniref:uncharacterized protein n=1 Tax=Palaemon carinicauda TaxID=392227 RepID=UPI0035B5E6E2